MKKPDLIPGLRVALRIAQHWEMIDVWVIAARIEARIAREKKARKRGR